MSAVTADDIARLEGQIRENNQMLNQIAKAMGLTGERPRSLKDIEQQALADVYQFRKKRSKNDGKTG